jgi:hypothetical protein
LVLALVQPVLVQPGPVPPVLVQPGLVQPVSALLAQEPVPVPLLPWRNSRKSGYLLKPHIKV